MEPNESTEQTEPTSILSDAESNDQPEPDAQGRRGRAFNWPCSRGILSPRDKRTLQTWPGDVAKAKYLLMDRLAAKRKAEQEKAGNQGRRAEVFYLRIIRDGVPLRL